MNRLRHDLSKLIENLRDETIHKPFIEAFVQDTGFVQKEVYRREILTPTHLLKQIIETNCYGQQEFGQQDLGPTEFGTTPSKNGPVLNRDTVKPLGTVAIVLPKNSLGIPLAKAVAASYLMGNQTIVRIPRQLLRSEPIYRDILRQSLPNIQFSKPNQSAKDFLIDCLQSPHVDAIVVYGDDAWIDEYFPLAKATQTKFIFEGPGNDPLIVLPDADLQLAVEGAVTCGLNNGGQSCSALERFFIHHSVLEPFLEGLVNRLATLNIGIPSDPTVDLGPITSLRLLDRLQHQIQGAIAQGATLLTGGKTIQNPWDGSLSLQPTVLTHCTPTMAIVQEETFGPVFPVLSFDGMAQLISMVDATRYGLNASVYGNCPTLLRAYLESNHRNVFLNSTAVSPENHTQLSVDGGYKRSGFIWEQTSQGYCCRKGRRYLTQELSQVVNKMDSPPTSQAECLPC